MDDLVDHARPGNRTGARQTHGARRQKACDRIHSATQTTNRDSEKRIEGKVTEMQLHQNIFNN